MLHYLFLWNAKELESLTPSQKFDAITAAVRLFKQDKQADFLGRELLVLAAALLPAIIIFINFNLIFATIMFIVGAFILEGFLTKSEVPFIREFLSSKKVEY